MAQVSHGKPIGGVTAPKELFGLAAASEKPRTSPAKGHRERLRQRFMEDQSDLTDVERLELLLTFGIPRRDVKPLASALLGRFGSLDAVFTADRDGLLCVDGIGDHAATLLMLVGSVRSASNSAATPEAEQGSQSTTGELFPTRTPIAPPESTEKVGKARPDRSAAQAKPPKPKPVTQRSRTGLFSGCVFRDALRLAAKIPLGSNVEQARQLLQEKGLHYSGASTRRRYASYIISRTFPTGVVDDALCHFVRAFEGTQSARDVMAYRHMTAEPLTREATVELLVHAIGRPAVARAHLRKYLARRFPNAKPNSINHCAQAIVEILGESQLVGATRTTLSVHSRPVELRSFGFIVHSEFPEPGMHRLDELEGSAVFRAMLWTKEDMKTALYELRNQGLISKISEIDSLRHFTTRHSLDEAVDKLVGMGGAR